MTVRSRDKVRKRVHERIRTYTYLYPADGRPDVYTDAAQAAEQALRTHPVVIELS